MGKGAKRQLGVALALAALALGASTSPAAASPLVPPGFVLPASHGYKIFGLFFDGTPHEERDELLLIVARKDSAVTYFVPAKADETSVSADLGALGLVDLRFVPAGRPRPERTPCGTPRRVEVERGAFEGSFAFRGEEGFARATATRMPAFARIVLGLICGGNDDVEGFGGHAPGAQLKIHQRGAAATTDFEARTNSPTRPAYLEASVEEKRGRIGITRQVSFTAPPPAFRFDFAAKTATVKPGGPFHGSAKYDGSKAKRSRMRGNLTVDFPGHAGVRLLGPRTSAGMVRYVDNPSHPFALPGADALRVPRLGAWPTTKPWPTGSVRRWRRGLR